MHDEDRILLNIERCRRVNRSAAKQYAARGVMPADIAIAAIYSAFDLATEAQNCPIAAIEWIRTAMDVIERQHLRQTQPAHIGKAGLQ